MWFLGNPRPNPTIALTFSEPGPVEIDFEELNDAEKAHILTSVRLGKIETNVDYASLFNAYRKPEPVTVPEPTKQELQVTQLQKDLQAARQVLSERDKLEISLQAKCKYLVSKGVRSLKAALTKEDNIRVFKTILAMEQKKKIPRQSVILFLNEKIKQNQIEVIKDIEKSADSPPLVDRFRPYDNIKFEIEETDQEIIHFAMGAPLEVTEEIEEDPSF